MRGTNMSNIGYELRLFPDGTGDGVYATKTLRIGDVAMVGVIEGSLDGNDSHATQVSRTRWIRHAGLGPKVNHSCNPNCGVRLNATGACDFIVRKQIEIGEELTFDYAMRNYSIEHFPGNCLCGADDCRGSVTGWKDLSNGQKAAYDGEVLPYLLELDAEDAQR